MSDKYFHLAVDAPISAPLTYLPPNEYIPLGRGDSVRVPLGKRTVDAVVLGKTSECGDFELKPIQEKIIEKPILPEKFLGWLEWLAKYYSYPIGQVTKLAFPPLVKKTKARKSHKSPVVPSLERNKKLQLTTEQQKCFEGISRESGFNIHLLHGVTGSGKTEIYLQLIEDVLNSGKTALVLVPEISLTPQLLNRFSARFPEKVAVIHSHLTDREKTEQWWFSYNNERPILLGARSALFCPRENLGLIIVDEEHESSYKQDEKLKYNARDAAIMLAKMYDCPIVLGSATPSLESWHNAKTGKYYLHQMNERVSSRPMPEIKVVALQDRDKTANLPFWLSSLLYTEIQDSLAKKEQVALFLNRRGVAQFVQCFDCGYTYECPNCEISLTLHGKSDLVCHYCNYTTVFKEKCPDCQSENISAQGVGTEQVEKDVSKLFPDAVVQRADRDEISKREQMEDLIKNMEMGNIDILIGTQMIAKGLDFPGLNLVGLILADVGFHLPDFRASERSYQLITQVAGRAGRHSQVPGKVIVQTFNPQQKCLQFALNNDFEGFCSHELQQRQELSYPPFGRLALIRIVGNTLLNTQKAAQHTMHMLQSLKNHRTLYNEIKVLGPAPAPMTKLRNKYRYHILVKSPNAQTLQALLNELAPDFGKGLSSVKLQIDIDPYNMM
ncbi:MAG: primosomal protein N' [Bdellovibrionales bacterium]|nr:primosomal protein N' [Bdellovibrionales bacterium]